MISLRVLPMALLALSAGCAQGLVDAESAEDVDEAALVNAALDGERREVGLLERVTGPGKVSVCTASLIGTHTLLTAGHCVVHDGVQADPSIVSFTLENQRYAVARVEAHPAYGTEALPNHDVALVELVADVQDTRPLRLLERPPIVGESVVLVGYGLTSDMATVDRQRRVGRNQIASLSGRWYQMLGASGADSGVCRGDSGGPTLFARGGALVLGGVHSTATCDERPLVEGGDPNVSNDTRVDRYVDFIESTAQGNLYAGGAYEVAEPTLTFTLVGGSGRRASSDGLLRLAVVAADDVALDRLVVFVNGEQQATLHLKQASWAGEIAIASPAPRPDGSVWIQVAAIDRSGRRTNANRSY